jgi:bacterioferritin
MKGNQKIIDSMNSLLADELTAVSQYMVHANICANWGYDKLDKVIEKRAIDEMKHAEKLIARIIFLEGKPIVSTLREFTISDKVPEMFDNDHVFEDGAIAAYNKAIKLAGDVADFATREMLESILQDEDKHIDGIEEVQDEIKQMGIQIFLSTQLG